MVFVGAELSVDGVHPVPGSYMGVSVVARAGTDIVHPILQEPGVTRTSHIIVRLDLFPKGRRTQAHEIVPIAARAVPWVWEFRPPARSESHLARTPRSSPGPQTGRSDMPRDRSGDRGGRPMAS